MDEDYQVSLVRRAIEAGIQSIPVTFSVEGESELPDARAEALSQQLAELWDATLTECSEALSKGRVAFEKVAGYDAEHNLSVVRKLDQIPFKLSRMKLENGCFAGIEVNVNSKWETIHPDSSWWLAINPTPLQPHGTGIYAGAPAKSWRTRQEAIRLRDVHIRRFVLEWLLIRCRPTIEDDEGQQIDNFDRMLDAADAMRSGGAMAMSNERDPETNEPLETIEAVGAERKDADHLDKTLDGMDAEQVRAFGFPESVITDGKIGSYAKLKEQTPFLHAVCLGLLRQIVTSFQKYIVDKSVDLNFADGVAIKAVYPKMKDQQNDWTIEVAKAMLMQPALSPLILSGAVDLRQMLEGVGAALTPDAEAKLEKFLAEQRAALQAQQGTQGVPGEPGAIGGPSGGQYAGIGRRQWQNNVKAIGDVLDQLAAGSLTETRAKVLLRSLDVPDEQAGELIADAADGTVETQLSRRLANPRVPKEVESKNTILAEALRELSSLKEELRDVVARGAKSGKLAEAQVAKILDRMRSVNIAATLAARLMGMVSPWKPSLIQRPGPKAERLPVALAGGEPVERKATLRTLALPGVSGGDFYRFPWLADAADFIEAKQLATPDELAALSKDVQLQVLSAPGVSDADVLGRIRSALSAAVKSGETRADFAARIDSAVALTDAQMETLFRTNVHQSYIEGQEKTLANPVIDEEFPYVLFAATSDTRTRPEHDVLDGFVVRRGTPEYNVLRRALEDWNCRCHLIVLSEDDAKSHRIRELSDIPQNVRAMYG